MLAVTANSIGVIGALVISAFGAASGFYMSIKAERSKRAADRSQSEAAKSANVAKTVELGVTQLIDQLQEERQDLRVEVSECKGRCTDLEQQVVELRREVDDLKAILDDRDAEVIRLKGRLGELT